MAHNIAHILYNMARISGQPNEVDLALLNKFDDYVHPDKKVPKEWFELQTRRITRTNDTIVEVDLNLDNCESFSNVWAKDFIVQYVALHGLNKTCNIPIDTRTSKPLQTDKEVGTEVGEKDGAKRTKHTLGIFFEKFLGRFNKETK